MTTSNTHNNIEEILWDICIESRSFLNQLKSSKINLGNLKGDFEDLMLKFKPLMKEKRLLNHLAEEYYQNRQYKKVLDIYDKLDEDLSLEMMTRKGDIYIVLEDFEKAREQFDKLLEMDEDNPVYWFKKAYLIYKSGTVLEDAVFYLESALELNPDHIDALILMAKAWLERADKKKDKFVSRRMIKEAKKCLEKAKKQNEDTPSPEKEFNLSRIYALFSKVEPDKGEDHWKISLENLEKVLQVKGSGKLSYLEKIQQEKIFAEMGLVLDFPANGMMEEPETEETEVEETEDEVETQVKEDESSGETKEEKENTLTEEEQLYYGDAEKDYYKEPGNDPKVKESEGRLSPTQISGKKETSKKDDYKPSSFEMLRPEDLGL